MTESNFTYCLNYFLHITINYTNIIIDKIYAIELESLEGSNFQGFAGFLLNFENFILCQKSRTEGWHNYNLISYHNSATSISVHIHTTASHIDTANNKCPEITGCGRTYM